MFKKLLLKLLNAVPVEYHKLTLGAKDVELKEQMLEYRAKVGFVIDEKEIEGTYEHAGKTEHWFDEDTALAILIAEGVCFVSGQDYVAPWSNTDKTCAVVVNCNDVFYWASGDAEPLPNSQIEKLYRMWKANKDWGSIKWCCLHRNLRPQVPIVRDMKKDGFWDAELEALPAPSPS